MYNKDLVQKKKIKKFNIKILNKFKTLYKKYQNRFQKLKNYQIHLRL